MESDAEAEVGGAPTSPVHKPQKEGRMAPPPLGHQQESSVGRCFHRCFPGMCISSRRLLQRYQARPVHAQENWLFKTEYYSRLHGGCMPEFMLAFGFTLLVYLFVDQIVSSINN